MGLFGVAKETGSNFVSQNSPIVLFEQCHAQHQNHCQCLKWHLTIYHLTTQKCRSNSALLCLAEDGELRRTLQSLACGKARVLVKKPKVQIQDVMNYSYYSSQHLCEVICFVFCDIVCSKNEHLRIILVISSLQGEISLKFLLEPVICFWRLFRAST